MPTTLTDLTREEIHNRREQHIHSGTVDRVTGDGIYVVVEGEDASGPFPYLGNSPSAGDIAVILDTDQGFRVVLAPFGT